METPGLYRTSWHSRPHAPASWALSLHVPPSLVCVQLQPPPFPALAPAIEPTSTPTEKQPASCRHLTELRNLTKGPCHLDQVQVSYCSGHCQSSTNVMTEVTLGLLTVPQGPAWDLDKTQGTGGTQSTPTGLAVGPGLCMVRALYLRWP